jgi:uncharacterized protein (TIGR02391 family)
MASSLSLFEAVARRSSKFAYAEEPRLPAEHPFEPRNIHPLLPKIVRKLFDNGHYSQATFEAFKFVDKVVAKISGANESGFKLMMLAFAEATPLVKLTACSTTSERDEQKGYQFLFAGAMLGIRNPRGHEYSVQESPDECLDHLSLASLLLRKIESAGLSLPGA